MTGIKLQAAVDAELTAKLAKIPSADAKHEQTPATDAISDMRAKDVAQIVSTLVRRLRSARQSKRCRVIDFAEFRRYRML